MFRIGLVDWYLDEWHAQNYPQMLREEAKRLGMEIEVSSAFAFCDKPGGMSNAEWSRKQGVPLAESLDALAAAVDGVMVLAPSFPERHFDMAEPAIRAGRPVYVDKIFAPNEAEGKKLFDRAQESGVPLFSSSALRFDAALEKLRGRERGRAVRCLTCGPNAFEIYAIHQLEMIESVMGRAQRAKYLGNEGGCTVVFDYGGGKQAQMVQMPSLPFQIAVSDGAVCSYFPMGGDFFPRLVDAILTFFQTGIAPVSRENTLNALAMLTAAQEARRQPDQWIEV